MSSKRGPGAPKGKRPVEYICGAIVDSKLVMESFVVHDQTPDDEKARIAALPKGHKDKTKPGIFPQEIAEEAFYEKYGVKPEGVVGPKADYKGGKYNSSKKRLTIDRDNIDNFTVTSKVKNAIWGDWRGMVMMLKETDSKGLFTPISTVDSSSKKRLIKGGIVEISDLEFIDENDENILEQESQ